LSVLAHHQNDFASICRQLDQERLLRAVQRPIIARATWEFVNARDPIPLYQRKLETAHHGEKIMLRAQIEAQHGKIADWARTSGASSARCCSRILRLMSQNYYFRRALRHRFRTPKLSTGV